MAAKKTLWAVLLCMFEDKNDPAPFAPVKTINDLFTTSGDSLFNVTRFFREMSHGSVDLTGSQVFGPFLVPGTKSGPIAGKAARELAMDQARNAAIAVGVPLGNFQFVCVIFNTAIGGNQGATGWGTVPPLPGVITDFRYAMNNGTADFGHEMGHAYGLNHARLGAADEPPGEDYDYQDPWDVMSYARNAFAADPVFGQRGPGLNAWNMRSLSWLDESRVWKPTQTTFDQTIELRPLHRRDFAGSLAAELPPNDGAGGHGRYLVEYRIKENWDANIPRSAVFVHRFSKGNSYLLTGAQAGGLWLSSQNGPNGGFSAWAPLDNAVLLGETAISQNADGRLEVFATDTADGLLWHDWQVKPNGSWHGWQWLREGKGLGKLAVGRNQDGRLEVFAIDTADHLVWHNWQVAPNGGWHGWVWLRDGKGLGEIAVGQNQDGRLEVFATDTADGLVWHNWQVAPNGGWHGWQWLREGKGLGKLAVGRNQDGRLEVFAIDTADHLVWHNWQVAPNGGWHGWVWLRDGKGLGEIAVGQNQDGRLEVFATDTADGLVWHNWQVAPNGGWNGWEWLREGKGLGKLTVGRNADGRLDVFAIDTADHLVWRATQNSANAAFGPWALAADAHGGFGHIAVAAQANGALDLVAVDTVGHADVAAGETINLGMNGGPNVQVQVVKIDDANRTATVRLISQV